MKTCPRTAVQTRDRNLQVRLLLEMNPERCSMLTAGAPFEKKPGSQQASWQTPVQW
jgi:hypothetical protein